MRADVEARIARLELELDAKGEQVEPPELIDRSFPAQSAFLLDQSLLIAVLCTRRAGKSFGAALRLLRAAYRRPGASSLYVALTRDSAKKILWKDCLKVINRKLGLGAKFNETDLTMTLPNGSVIYLLGVDTTEDEKAKLLGQKYAEVVIDEAASYSIDLMELVYGILKPATTDYRGPICLIGTPGNLKKGLFFDLTSGQDPGSPGQWEKMGWSGHRWSAMDNPHIRENWLAEIADLRAANPGIEETPLFQQHYLGRWVTDSSKLVYRYEMGRNDFDGILPQLARGNWHYVIGVDLGFNDATAITLGAYHDHDRTLYGVLSYKESGLDITDVANRVNKLRADYDVDTVIIDGANKQAVVEMNRRHNVGAKPADKTGKADFIDLLNAEMIQGRVRWSPGCQVLKDEAAGLIWDERGLEKNKRVEHPGCENHALDSWLYLWRYAFAYLSESLKPKIQEGSEAWRLKQIEEMRQQAEDEFNSRREPVEGLYSSDNWEA